MNPNTGGACLPRNLYGPAFGLPPMSAAQMAAPTVSSAPQMQVAGQMEGSQSTPPQTMAGSQDGAGFPPQIEQQLKELAKSLRPEYLSRYYAHMAEHLKHEEEAAFAAMEQQKWDELSASDKINRLVECLRISEKRIDFLRELAVQNERKIEELAEQFAMHTHLNGEVVIHRHEVPQGPQTAGQQTPQ